MNLGLKDTAQLKSYTELRKQREEFRKELVHLILRDHETVAPDEIPSKEEREALRYYYYIKYGVDTVYVAPLDQHILERVKHLKC